MNKPLRERIIKVYEEIVEHREFDLPTEDALKEVMPLPEDFKEKLKQRAKREKKYVYIWGKQISKVAIFIFLLLMTGISVYAMVKTKFIYRIFKQNTVISTFEEEMQSGEEYLEHIYYPQETLDFEMDSTTKMDTSIITLYSNPAGETLTFIQQVIQTQYLFDNEHTKEERVVLNGVEAIRFVKNGEVTLIWCSDGYLYELNAPEQYLEQITDIAGSLEQTN